MEWLIAVATALGSLLTTAAVVFRRSLAKARRGGRAKVQHTDIEAERIIAAAEQYGNTKKRALPRLRKEVESKEQGGTVIREAEDLQERSAAAEAEARRSAQSFNANLGRYAAGLDRLRKAGVLIDTPTGPMLDPSRIHPWARESAARVGGDLQELEWFRVSGQEDGISGPLTVPAFTKEDVAGIAKSASRPGRIDKEQIRKDEYRARGLGDGHDPRTESPRSLTKAMRGKKWPFRRSSAAKNHPNREQAPGRKL